MTPDEQTAVDTLYANFKTHSPTPSPCPACGAPILRCKDMDGTEQWLDTAAPIYVQIRDSDQGEHAVMRVEGFVAHLALCRGAGK